MSINNYFVVFGIVNSIHGIGKTTNGMLWIDYPLIS